MTDDRTSRIDDVIYKFNFHKVLVAMQALDWRWSSNPNEPSYIPTIRNLKEKARNLLLDSVNNKITGSGGFEARYHPSVDGDPEWFELRFIIEDVESFDDDD